VDIAIVYSHQSREYLYLQNCARHRQNSNGRPDLWP